MFLSNFPQKIVEPLLREVNSNQVLLEQHLDFITSRSFRQTILIPETRSQEIQYRLDHAQLQRMHFAGTFTPIPPTAGLNSSSFFSTVYGVEINITHSIAIMTAQILNDHYPSTLQIHVLAQKVQKRLPQENLADCLSTILQFVDNMIVRGAIRFRTTAVELAVQIPEFPIKDPSACYTQLDKNWITNVWHDSIQLNIVEQSILPLLDGEHDVVSLREHLRQEVANGQITFKKEDQPITNPEELATSINDHLQASLLSLKRKGLLAR